MKLNKCQCEFCERDITQARCIIFLANDDNSFFGIPSGVNVLVCMECNLSFMSQMYGISGKEIDGYLKWIDSV